MKNISWIISVEITGKEADFLVLRQEKENPRVKDHRKITMLWRPELNHLLELNKLPKYRDRSKAFVRKTILERVPSETLWPQVYEELFERDYTTNGERIEEYRKKH